MVSEMAWNAYARENQSVMVSVWLLGLLTL